MFWAESYRGKKVVKIIESYDSIIKIASKKYNVDSNFIRAIIYEEQTHNKTPLFEWIPLVNSVGPMAVSKIHWGHYNRSEMQNIENNILLGAKLLSDSKDIIEYNNRTASIAQIASNYNLEQAITKTTYYGRRVEYFYEWFKKKYEE